MRALTNNMQRITQAIQRRKDSKASVVWLDTTQDFVVKPSTDVTFVNTTDTAQPALAKVNKLRLEKSFDGNEVDIINNGSAALAVSLRKLDNTLTTISMPVAATSMVRYTWNRLLGWIQQVITVAKIG